jgi:hypothetical protein
MVVDLSQSYFENRNCGDKALPLDVAWAICVAAQP